MAIDRYPTVPKPRQEDSSVHPGDLLGETVVRHLRGLPWELPSCLLTCNTTAHVTGLQQRNPCVGPASLREDVLLSPGGDVISWLGARETIPVVCHLGLNRS